MKPKTDVRPTKSQLTVRLIKANTATWVASGQYVRDWGDSKSAEKSIRTTLEHGTWHGWVEFTPTSDMWALVPAEPEVNEWGEVAP